MYNVYKSTRDAVYFIRLIIIIMMSNVIFQLSFPNIILFKVDYYSGYSIEKEMKIFNCIYTKSENFAFKKCNSFVVRFIILEN